MYLLTYLGWTDSQPACVCRKRIKWSVLHATLRRGLHGVRNTQDLRNMEGEEEEDNEGRERKEEREVIYGCGYYGDECT